MPRREGLRDDDMLGRIADLETRMDALEDPKAERFASDDPALRVVPSRDERRDTEPRARQTMVSMSGGDHNDRPAMDDPDDAVLAGVDNTAIVSSDDRDEAEAQAEDDRMTVEQKAEAKKKRDAAAKRKADREAEAKAPASLTNPFAAPEAPKE